MKRGPKAKSVAELHAAGTFRPDRHAQLRDAPASRVPPLMPDYLQPGARAVWEENLMRAVAAGVCDADSDLFGRYCSLESMIRRAFQADEPPPAAYLAEARRMAELLRIAGPSSRVGAASAAAGTGRPNPFANLGIRPPSPPSRK